MRVGECAPAKELGFQLGEIDELLGLENACGGCSAVRGVAERRVTDLDRRITDLRGMRGAPADLTDRVWLTRSTTTSARSWTTWTARTTPGPNPVPGCGSIASGRRAPVYAGVPGRPPVAPVGAQRDGTPGSVVYVTARGVEEFHAEISAKPYRFLSPGLDEWPAGGACLSLLDPFGNALRIEEQIVSDG